MKRLLLLLISITGVANIANAQWITNGPGGQDMVSFLTNGSTFYAGSFADGLFVSINNGGSWSSVNSISQIATVNTLALSGSTMYLGTFGTGALIY